MHQNVAALQVIQKNTDTTVAFKILRTLALEPVEIEADKIPCYYVNI